MGSAWDFAICCLAAKIEYLEIEWGIGGVAVAADSKLVAIPEWNSIQACAVLSRGCNWYDIV